MNAARIAFGLPVTVGLAWLLAASSGVNAPWNPAGATELRLSWSARPERIEVCRQVSDEEQAKREEHMRQRVECEGRFATYALRVEVDGRAIGESVIHGAGLRHDRPLYLLRDYPVPPGQHRVRVTLTRREKTDDDAADFDEAVVPDADTGLFAGRAQREVTERARSGRAAIPPTLVLDTAFAFTPRRVALVTFNAERRILELHAEAHRK